MRGEGAIPWDKLNTYLLKCGGVHESYQFCVTVLDGMHDLIEFDEGVFLMLDGNRRIMRKYFSNISRHWSSMYLEYFAHSSSSGFGLDADVSEEYGTAFVELIDWDRYGWLNDDFMISYIRARGLRSSLTFVLYDLNGAPSGVFSLDRMTDSKFQQSDVELLHVVVAHLNNLYKNLFVMPMGFEHMWDNATGASELTPREREVCDLLCQGVTPNNISRKLHISLGTTNKHIAHIYRKFGVGSRQELLVRLLAN